MRVKDIPNSYEKATLLLSRKQERKVSHNGYLLRLSPDTIMLKLHNTVIVTWYQNGEIKLNHANWITRTTQVWLNYALRGVGYVSISNDSMKFVHEKDHTIQDIGGGGLTTSA